MWHFHLRPMLLLAMRVMIALALERDIVSVRSSYLGYGDRHAPRQAPPSAPAVITITTTIDYSSVAAPTPASRPSSASNPAIVISFLSPSTTTTSPTSTFFSTSALSFLSSSQNTTTSTPTYSPSSTASPILTTARSPFNFIYLIPAFALTGILLGGLIGWLLYRCITRKHRVRRDDGALLIGPRYIGIDEPEHHHIQDHDTERRGAPTQMKNLPGATRASPHFRWPSFNEKPAFDPVRGFHVPDEYPNGDDPFLAPTIVTRPNTNLNARVKSTRSIRTSKSTRTFKSTRSTAAGPSRNVLPSPTSDTTSLALLELYESDEEQEMRRKVHEVPWESLRHKSIKRGIIEQVKKENKWMDSVRGLAGSTLLASRPEAIIEEGSVLLGGPDADESMEVDSYVGRRRRYPIPDSDPFADSPTRTHSISPKKRPVGNSRRTDSTTTFPASMEPHGVGFQIIPDSAATTPNHSPRRSFTWLKQDDANKRLTRLPTPIPEGRQSRSQSSRITSPVKRTSNSDLPISQVPRRDILPRSPAQIMSPPLHSQICFTPIPASPAGVHPHHSKSRVPVSLSPTRPLMVSSASKGKRKIQSPYNPHRLPKPPSSAKSVVPDVRLSQHAVSRGRVRDTAATNDMKQAPSHSKESGDAIAVETRPDLLEDPIKKVEQIMASSWSARDLGQGGMRSLSPTGFGRHP
ncbi:hypothetical protein BYT27DRAFT_6463680 [Phlegmacium glaucopus]|nr:hypothetical protein BYT27DRAFT_6463680 [Phlegmacium glaucopus]